MIRELCDSATKAIHCPETEKISNDGSIACPPRTEPVRPEAYLALLKERPHSRSAASGQRCPPTCTIRRCKVNSKPYSVRPWRQNLACSPTPCTFPNSPSCTPIAARNMAPFRGNLTRFERLTRDLTSFTGAYPNVIWSPHYAGRIRTTGKGGLWF